MLFQTGKNKGKTSQEVFLKTPDFAQWMMSEYPDSAASKAFHAHQVTLDAKPLVKPCYQCKKPATRATAYQGSPDLMFWCDDCDPYGAGAIKGKLSVVTTFADAMRHIDYTANGNRTWKRAIQKQLAQAKGLPTRVGVQVAVAFLP
jgi:hypothetical protein